MNIKKLIMKPYVLEIFSIACFLLFLIFLYKFGFTALFLEPQNVNPQEGTMKFIRFLSGTFLGLCIIFAIPLLESQKQPENLNYVEVKINRIFNKNFSSGIRSSYERLRTIEYEILDYEFSTYIDMAIEISKINQELYYQLLPIAYSIIAIIIASSTLLVNLNPNFSNGFIIGLSIFVIILIVIILDKFNKWKTMYSDLMLLKSNRETDKSKSLILTVTLSGSALRSLRPLR